MKRKKIWVKKLMCLKSLNCSVRKGLNQKLYFLRNKNYIFHSLFKIKKITLAMHINI